VKFFIALSDLSTRKNEIFVEEYIKRIPLGKERREAVNFQDSKGYSPVFYAVKQGKRETLQLLLHSGCDVRQKDCKGRTL